MLGVICRLVLHMNWWVGTVWKLFQEKGSAVTDPPICFFNWTLLIVKKKNNCCTDSSYSFKDFSLMWNTCKVGLHKLSRPYSVCRMIDLGFKPWKEIGAEDWECLSIVTDLRRDQGELLAEDIRTVSHWGWQALLGKMAAAQYEMDWVPERVQHSIFSC